MFIMIAAFFRVVPWIPWLNEMMINHLDAVSKCHSGNPSNQAMDRMMTCYILRRTDTVDPASQSGSARSCHDGSPSR
jgi:hypothetical protein